MVDFYNPTMAVSSSSHPSLAGTERKHWWLSNRKMVERYIREAKMLIAAGEHSDLTAALGILDTALALAPRMEAALELKARCLLHLRRYKDVANMLKDHIPSLKVAAAAESSEENYTSSSSGSSSDSSLSRERVKLLSSSSGGGDGELPAEPAFKCFSSVSDLKKKVVAGLSKNVEKEGQWRYSVLGQACCHLGLMEDAMALLQTGKQLALDASRRESISLPDDIVPLIKYPLSKERDHNIPPQQNPPKKTEYETISHLLCHIKHLMRRKTAAMASLDAGLSSEAVRHFSKILEGRRGAPQGFLAECYVLRASAYESCGRIAEAIADCNKALALETSCIEALAIRAGLFEAIRCLPDSLHDLEHLKLLYNSMLRDRKLPCPAWKRQSVHYREIPGKLCSLASKIQQLKQRLAGGETSNVDYYALIGLRRGCSKAELERAHLLLALKHKPDKSSSFVERCEFGDGKEMDCVRDRARISAVLLYRLIQKGYTNIMATVLDEEANEKQRKKAAIVHQQQKQAINNMLSVEKMEQKAAIKTQASSAFKGVFCRDLAIVNNMLSQARFNRPLTVKYEALTY